MGKNKRLQNKIAAIAVFSIFILAMMYLFVYPRVKITLTLGYSEGLMNTFDVDIVLKNSGNRLITNLTLNITVKNETGSVLGSAEYKNIDIKPRAYYNMDRIHVIGDEYNTHATEYKIRVQIMFHSTGKYYRYVRTFVTEEPYMNILFRDEITQEYQV